MKPNTYYFEVEKWQKDGSLKMSKHTVKAYTYRQALNVIFNDPSTHCACLVNLKPGEKGRRYIPGWNTPGKFDIQEVIT
jgi:hypothetical protein